MGPGSSTVTGGCLKGLQCLNVFTEIRDGRSWMQILWEGSFPVHSLLNVKL